MGIQGKTILVTGGAKRLGRELVLTLAKEGARVALHYHSSSKDAKKTQSEAVGDSIELFQADLREKKSIEALIRQVEKKWGPIDILINSASVFNRTPWDQITESDWQDNWSIHTLAAYWLIRAVAPGMKRKGGGKIINIVDRTIFRTYKHYLPYIVTKAALASLTKTLALELAPEIQVNAIAPGLVLWPEDFSEEDKKKYQEKVPLKKIGSPKDFVAAVVSLIELEFATGAILPLDGGISL